MIIAENIIQRWNELKEHEDIENIAKESGISRVTISNAFTSKRASSKTIFAIDKYFRAKQTKLNKLTK
jgi:hypothetical protein